MISARAGSGRTTATLRTDNWGARVADVPSTAYDASLTSTDVLSSLRGGEEEARLTKPLNYSNDLSEITPSFGAVGKASQTVVDVARLSPDQDLH